MKTNYPLLFILIIASSCIILATDSSFALDTLDLRTWTKYPEANWTISSDGDSVLQTVNGNPTYFVSDTDYINTTFEGTFIVETSSDDDFIGFVFGFDGTTDFLLFDWKQANQDYSGVYGYEGFTLSRISGTDVNFWTHTGSDIEVLATDYATGKGWTDNVLYDFTLIYQENRIQILIDGDVIFDISGTFDNGKFGFYNYSQAYVRYQGFQRETAISDFFGGTIKIQNEYNTVVEQSEESKEVVVEVMNSESSSQSINIDIVNPHTGLFSIILSTDFLTIEAGEVADILLSINAGTIPVGVYDDILLKVTTDDGEILYSNITLTIVEPYAEDLPDLSISAEDIGLTDYSLGDTATLEAVVRNKGLSSASGVSVRFYEFGVLLGETVLDEVGADGSATASVTIPVGTSEGDHLIQVVVDADDDIEEISETNNEANKVVSWGESSAMAGNILVAGSSPSTVYAGDLFSVSGNAVYDIYVDGVRYTDYVVKGGSVRITLTDDSGNKWIYGNIHTTTDGCFMKYLQAPEDPGTYRIYMTVTDKTFTGNRELVFHVVEKPSTPQTPPSPSTLSGIGYWSYDETGLWYWTWTSLPGNEPDVASDLSVFSENIYFSNDNPDPEEDITIFAEINYWATSTDITAENIPVNLYATYPGSDKEKIGSAVVSSLSVGTPDFGSRYVYGTWKNQGQGVYIIEVEIDPGFAEENMLNNAATRAIIVGDLESYHGVIQGQVTDAWGGIEDVVIELYDEDGSVLTSSTLTDATGHYCFEILPIGNYQVHIVLPDGYAVESDTRQAAVLDQQITVVDFYLTREEETLCGDLDHDEDVDETDRNILREAFGTVESDDGFVQEADYDLDGDIDYSDYQLWYYCYKQYVSGM